MIKQIILIILLANIVFAQNILWKNCYNTGTGDYAQSITSDSEGNIIVAAFTFYSNIYGSSVVIKYNSDGDTLWTKFYETYAVDIVTDSYNNIIIAGQNIGDSTGQDVNIIKCNPDGDILWNKVYNDGKHSTEETSGVDVDTEDNIIVSATTQASTTSLGAYLLIKFDGNGCLLWDKIYDEVYEDYSQDIVVDNNNNLIITGYSDSNINWDWLTIKCNCDGKIIWTRRYDLGTTDWPYKIATDNDNNIIVAGVTSAYYPGNGGSTAMIIKYSSEGDTILEKTFQDNLLYEELNSFSGVVSDSVGNIYLSGNYGKWDSLGVFRSKFYVSKCSAFGDTIWTFKYGEGLINETNGIAIDQENNIVVTGSIDANLNRASDDFIVTLKLDVNTTSLGEAYQDYSNIYHSFHLEQNYPNPFNPSTTIKYSIPRSTEFYSVPQTTLKVYDILGSEVATLVNEKQNAGNYEVNFNAKNLSSGIYYYRLKTGSFVESKKMILLK